MVQIAIESVHGQQFLMCAMLFDPPMIDHIDLVSIENRGKTMRNHEGRTAHHQFVQGSLHHLFAFRIQGRCRLVQNQNARIFQDGTGDGHALALTARKIQPSFADLRVVALRQITNERIRIRRLGGLDDLLVRRIQPSVADILHDRCAEEQRFLRHNANLLPQGIHRHVPDIQAIDPNITTVYIIKPWNEICNGGFSGAAGPYKCNHLSGFCRKRQIRKRIMLMIVGERHMLHLHMSLDLRQRLCSRMILHAFLHIQHGKDAVHSRHRLLDGSIYPGNALDRIGQIDRIGQKRHQRARRDLIVDDFIAAEPYNERYGEGRKELHGRRQEARELHALHGGPEVQHILLLEPLDLICLAHKGLDHAYGGNAFLQQRRDIRQPLLNDRSRPLELASEDLHGLPDHRDDRQGQKAQLPIQIDHHGKGTNQNGALRHQLDQIVHQRRLDRVDIIREIAHGLACLMLVEIGHGHALELAEHDLPHIDYYALPDIGHQIGLPIVEKPPEQEHPYNAH